MKNLYLIIFSLFIFNSKSVFSQLPQFEWANTLDTITSPFSLTSSSSVSDVTTDATGNVYSVGYFYGSIDANSGSGTTTLASISSGAHGFILKTSATGILIWAKAIEGEGVSEVNSVKVDASGNVYFMGVFGTTVDFNPGSGVFSMTSTNYRDIFMEKLDIDGNFVWAKKIAAAGGIVANAVDVDPSGNPVFVGYFSGLTDFDPNAGVVSLNGPSNSFVLKLDVNGDFVFVKNFTAISTNEIYDFEIKANGDMVLVGRFSSATDFNPDAGVYELTTNQQSQDAFMCQLNNNGNFMWAKKFGGGNSDAINALDIDNSGNIFLTGTFRNYVDFDLSSTSFVLQTSASTLDDIFIAKYSSTGDFIWVKQIGNPNENYTDENANDIAVDPAGNVTITGFFYNQIDFNPGTPIYNLYAGNSRNVFVCQLNAAGGFIHAFNFDSGGQIAGGEAFALDIDNSGNTYIGAYSSETYDVNPDTNVVNNISCESNQGLLLKYGPSSSAAAFYFEVSSGCVDKTIALQSHNSYLQSSWLWTSTGGTIVNSTSPNASISFPSSGTYTVTLTTVSGLGTTVSTKTINVNNNPAIIVQASPNIVCEGQSTTLWATHDPGILRWGWFQNNTHLTIYPTVDTLITATIYASNGCSASSSQFIQVATASSTTISVTNDTICSGSSITLTANGAIDYVWSTGDLTQSITVNPTSFSAYSVTGITGTCQATANQVINVVAVPSASIQSSSNVSCAGASVVLTAMGGSSYLWSTGETTSSISVSPSSATTYSVTVYNQAGCSDFATKTISVGTSPTINLVSSNMTPCAGSTITLTAVGGVSYLWGTGQTTNSITASPTITTTYSVVGTNTAGCQTYFERTIIVDPLPVVTVVSNVNSVCAGSPVTITASGGSSYTWSSGQNTAAITVSPTATTTYTASTTNSFNCTGSASKTITVNALPNVTIQSTGNSICEGESISLTGSGASTYLWNNGQTATTISVTPIATTSYTLTGTSATGCQGSASKTITVDAIPTVTFTQPTEQFCSNGASYNLVASPSGGVFSGQGVSNSIFNPAQGVIGSNVITYLFTQGACEVSEQIAAIVNDCAALEETKNLLSISLYPNPTNENISLFLNENKNVTVKVYDLSGKLIFEESNINVVTTSIPSSGFMQGLYILNVFNQELNLKIPFVKL